MAKIVKRKIRWVPSTAADVTGYRLYWNLDGPVDPANTADSKLFEVANLTLVEGKLQVLVPDDIPALEGVDDDTVTIGIAAVDDVGNESDVVEVTAPFDASSPSAPSGLEVTS